MLMKKQGANATMQTRKEGLGSSYVATIAVAIMLITTKTTHCKGGGGGVGVSYGMMVSNLPSANTVADVIKKNGITKMRIYNANEEVLEALKNTGIQMMVGVMNEELPYVAQPQGATQWVEQHILPYYPSALITHISVGNEVVIMNGQYLPCLMDAMTNIQTALDTAGLRGAIKVSTALPDSIITDFYPPSRALFDDDIVENMVEILGFLKDNDSPLMVHIHPYYAHTRSHGFVSLDYALFTARGAVVSDAGARKAYSNVFDAIYDSIGFAMADVGFHGIDVLVAETGWPTAGGEAASVRNAEIYNNHLVEHVTAVNITAFLFSLYDEDHTQSHFDPVESHFGVFRIQDSLPIYPLRFTL